MNKLGLFFKAPPDRRLPEKTKKSKGGKTSKQCLTAAFFIAADRSMVTNSILIWKSKSPRRFKKLLDETRSSNVHYFVNLKACMTSRNHRSSVNEN